MFDKDSIIGLAQLMEQFYNSEEYKLVQISQRLEELNVAGIFCDIARGFVEKLEEKLVFSADKPYPVVDKRIRVGERVFVESEGHELNNHWVTYFGTDKDGEGRAYVVGRNEHERVHLHGGQFSRGRGLHEIIIDSYLSFVHFMRSAPKEIVMANPFIPLDKDPEVGDLVYVIDGPMKERFCRIENIADDGMYELFTLHRRVHKHLAMTEDGFYVLAPNNGYDSEFFERPFLAL